MVAHLLVDAAESAGRFHLLVVEFSGDGNLMLHTRDGLLKVAEDTVELAELSVRLGLDRRVAQLVGNDKTFLETDEGLLEVAQASVRLAQLAESVLLVSEAFGL